VFDSTHIISSKAYSQYSDYPMPADWPDYPSRRLLIEYFRGYARHFGLYERIRFGTRVLRCEPNAAGGWRVSSAPMDAPSRGPSPTGTGTGASASVPARPSGRTTALSSTTSAPTSEVFDHLLVANGHHWDPRWPEYPGRFEGRYLHSHDFKSARGFEGLRVLVIGGGNSACDCACDVSRVAAKTAISMRRGYWFLPKFLLGYPNDALYARLVFLPPRLRQLAVGLLLRVLVGPPERYGLARPDHRVLESHPTLNSELLDRLRHGDVEPRGDIARFEGRTVRFKDGRSEEYDAVVACTGYRISFPFFDSALVSFDDGEVPLHLRLFHPTLANLYFIGLVQPLGCIWPLAERQARLVAERIAGRLRLPDDLEARARAHARRAPFHFLATPRHSVEVDYHAYSRDLERALRQLAA
jgi:cation diffusion facilitator CzcD-associated flavoprotein CzcO